MKQPVWGLCLFLLALLTAACGPNDRSGEVRVVPGVTDEEVVLGSSLALTGHAAYLGTQILRGAEAYLRYINDQGGVHGRMITVKAMDDSYDPPRCLANTQKFIIDNDVLALFCYVGTPTTIKILPLVEEAKIPLIGLFTGANHLREPFNPYVVNIRASYYKETQTAVKKMVTELGIRKIAVFYQYDAYGFDGLIGAELALKKYGMEPVARGSYIRGTLNVREGLQKIRESGAEAVVMVGTYGACARFIQLARIENYNPLFYNVSFVGAEELARRIGTGPSSVIMSQVVPPLTAQGNKKDAASQYAHLLQHYFPGERPSFAGLEGFLNARILVEGLKKAGRDLTRAGLIKAIESIRRYELGPGLSITYGRNDRQGLEKVYFTRLEDGMFQPFSDWAQLPEAQRKRQ